MMGTLTSELPDQLHVRVNPGDPYPPRTMLEVELLKSVNILQAPAQESRSTKVRAIFGHKICPLQVSTCQFLSLDLNLLTLYLADILLSRCNIRSMTCLAQTSLDLQDWWDAYLIWRGPLLNVLMAEWGLMSFLLVPLNLIGYWPIFPDYTLCNLRKWPFPWHVSWHSYLWDWLFMVHFGQRVWFLLSTKHLTARLLLLHSLYAKLIRDQFFFSIPNWDQST